MPAFEVYVTARYWDDAMVDALAGRVAGVILGDPFCQKRMFRRGAFDIPALARRARDRGLRVALQTPAYDTSRSFESTVALAQHLADGRLVDAVLLHDVGVLRAVRGTPEVELWWDRLSFNRDVVPNAPLLEFLVAQGISRVELLRASDAPAVAAAGCAPLLRAYGPEVVSFGRVCYTEYFLDEPCGTQILCRSRSPSVASVDKVRLDYVADGFTLLDRREPRISPERLGPLPAALGGITAEITHERELADLDRLVADAQAGRGERAPPQGSS